jgi:hypothetical protein
MRRVWKPLAWVSAVALTASGLTLLAPAAAPPAEAAAPPGYSTAAGAYFELSSNWVPDGMNPRDVLFMTGNNASLGSDSSVKDDNGQTSKSNAFISYWQGTDPTVDPITNQIPTMAAGYKGDLSNYPTSDDEVNGNYQGRMSAVDAGNYVGLPGYVGDGQALYVWNQDSHDFWKSDPNHPKEFDYNKIGTWKDPTSGKVVDCKPGNWSKSDRGSWISIVQYKGGSTTGQVFWVPNPRAADVASEYAAANPTYPGVAEGTYSIPRDPTWPCTARGNSANYDDGWGGGEVIQTTGEIFFSARQSAWLSTTYRAMIFNPTTGVFASSGLLRAASPGDAIFSSEDTGSLNKGKISGDLMIDADGNGYVIAEGKAKKGSIWHDPKDTDPNGSERAYIVRIVPTPNPNYDPTNPNSMRYLHNGRWTYNIVQRIYSDPTSGDVGKLYDVFGSLSEDRRTKANTLKGSDWYNGYLYTANNHDLYQINPMSGRATHVPTKSAGEITNLYPNSFSRNLNVRDMASGQEALTIDGQVFYDINGNGTRETGEWGVPGVSLALYTEETPGVWTLQTDPGMHITDSSGSYTMFLSEWGKYQIRVVEPGFNPNADPNSANFEDDVQDPTKRIAGYQTSASSGQSTYSGNTNTVTAHCWNEATGQSDAVVDPTPITSINGSNAPQACDGNLAPNQTDGVLASPATVGGTLDPATTNVAIYSTIDLTNSHFVPDADFGLATVTSYQVAAVSNGAVGTFTVDGQALTTSAFGTRSAAATIGPLRAGPITSNAQLPNSEWNVVKVELYDGATLMTDLTSQYDAATGDITWSLPSNSDLTLVVYYDRDIRCDPTKSSFSVAPSGPVEAGDSYNLTVTCLDKYGSPAAQASAVHFSAEDLVPAGATPPTFSATTCTTAISGPDVGKCSVMVESDVALTAVLHARVANLANGDLTDVNGNGVPAQASPQTRVWTACGDPTKSEFDVTPPGPLTVGTGTDNEYTLQLTIRNVNGGLCPDGTVGTFSIDKNAGDTQPALSDTECHTQGGVCSVTATSTKAGTWALHGLVNGQDVTNPGHASPQNRTWTHEGSCTGSSLVISPDPQKTGSKSTATLTSQDQYGNPCDNITPTLDGDGLTVGDYNASNAASGVYTWSVTTTTPGTYNPVATVPGSTATDDVTFIGPPDILLPAAYPPVATNTPEISGTGVPGYEIKVTEGGTVLCTATVDASGAWKCTPAAPLAEGPHEIQATQTDPVSSLESDPDTQQFTVDTRLPKVTITTPADDPTLPANTAYFVATQATPVGGDVTDKDPVTGLDAPLPGREVTVTGPNGAVLCTATSDAQGLWSCVIAANALSATADSTITATVSDLAGNTATDTQNLVPRCSPNSPGLSVTLVNDPDRLESQPGATSTANITIKDGDVFCNDINPNDIAVTATPAGLKTPLQATKVQGQDGKYAAVLEQVSPPVGATYTITATYGAQSGADEVTFYLEGAPQVVITSPTDNAQGNPPTIDPAQPLTVTGTAEDQDDYGVWQPLANADLVVTDGAGATLCTTKTAADGTWSCTIGANTLSATDPTDLTATATDPSGLEGSDTQRVIPRCSPLSSTIQLEFDITPESLPAGQTAVGTLSIRDMGAFCVVDPKLLSLTSTPAGLTATGPTDAGNGEYKWDLTAKPASTTTYTATTHYGAHSAADDVTFTVGPFTFDVPADDAKLADNTPTFGGTGSPGHTVTVTEGNDTLCSATVGANGNWTCDSTKELGQGDHTVTATETSANGQPSADPIDKTFTIVCQPDSTTMVLEFQITPSELPTGSTAVGRATVTDQGVVCANLNPSGWKALASTPAGLTATPAYPAPPTEVSPGVYAWQLTASPVVNTQYFVTAQYGTKTGQDDVTFIACTLATGCDFTFTKPADGEHVKDATPEFAGEGTPGDTVTVTDKATGAELCVATVNAAGEWSCSPTTPLAEGPHTVTATETDPKGQLAAEPIDKTFVVDTHPPTVTITTPPGDPAPFSPELATTIGGTVTDHDPATGTEQPFQDTTVTVKGPDGTVLCTDQTDAQGAWSCQIPANALSPTNQSLVSAEATDAAGNTGRDEKTLEPACKNPNGCFSFDKPADGAKLADDTPDFEGHGTPGYTVTVVDEDGDTLCVATVDADGNWKCTSTPLSQGPHTVTATETDPDGRQVENPISKDFIVDTVAPSVRITTPADDPNLPANTAPFDPNVVTQIGGDVTDKTPNGADQPLAGATVTVKGPGGAALCTATTDAQGLWACGIPAGSLPATGDSLVTAEATDPTGNLGQDEQNLRPVCTETSPTLDIDFSITPETVAREESATGTATVTDSGLVCTALPPNGWKPVTSVPAGIVADALPTSDGNGHYSWNLSADPAILVTTKYDVTVAYGQDSATDDVRFTVQDRPTRLYFYATAADGSLPVFVTEGYTVTARVFNQIDQPFPGVRIDFSNLSAPAGGAAGFSATTCVTDANGECSVTVTTGSAHKSGDYALEAQATAPGEAPVSVLANESLWQGDSADGKWRAAAAPSVRFEAGPEPISRLSVNPTTQVAGSPVRVKYDVADQYGNKINWLAQSDFATIGTPVDPPTNPPIEQFTNYSDGDKANGVYYFDATSKLVGEFELSGQAQSTPALDKPHVWFIPGPVCTVNCEPVDPTHLTRIEMRDNGRKADGVERDTAHAWAYDRYGNTVPDATVTSTRSPSSPDLNPQTQSVQTGPTGEADLWWTSTKAGVYTAMNSIDDQTTFPGSALDNITFVLVPAEEARLAVTPASPIQAGNPYTATVTAWADNRSILVEGAVVTYTVTPRGVDDSAHPVQLSSNTCTTGADGTCSVTVTGYVVGTYRIEAAITGVAPGDFHDNPQDVAWTAGAACFETTCKSNVRVTKDWQLANGTDTDEATLTVYDRWDNLVPGVAWQAATADSDLHIVNASGTTGADGQSVIQYTSLRDGAYQSTVTAGSPSQNVPGSPVTLNFGQLPPGDCTMSKEPASGVQVGGVYTITTVCLNDVGVPTHDLVVNHVTSDPDLTFKAGSSCTTDANGACSVQVTSTVADKKFTVDYATPPAADTSGNPVEVEFEAGPPTNSETRIVRNGAKNDGVDRNQVDVIAKDQYGNVVAGAAVTATSPDSRITVILEGSPVTGPDGKYSTYYTSTTYGVDFPVGFTVGGLVPTGGDGSPVYLRFLQGDLASVELTVTPKVSGAAVPLTVGKDPINTYNLEGKASDSSGDPVAGAPIIFRFVPAAGPTFTGGAFQCVTDAAGKCSVEAYSTKAGTYSAQAESGSILSAAVGVTWVPDEVCGVECEPDPSTDPSLYTRVEVIVDKQVADGKTADVVQLWAYDKWGNAVPNQLVTSTAPTGLTVMPNIPTTGDGTYGTTPGVSRINYYSTTAWTEFKPDIRVGVIGKMREPRGNPPTISFVAGPVCDTAVEITRNDAFADGSAYDQVKVTGSDCEGNATRGVAVELTTTDPVKPRVGVGNQATATLDDNGEALFDLVAQSTTNVVDSPVVVKVADANGVPQPAIHYSDSLRTVIAPSPTSLGDVGSSPALVDFRVLSAPVITSPEEGDLVADATPEITGTGEHPGAEVTVTDENGDVVCKGTVSSQPNANGDLTWSCTPGTPFEEGEHTIIATEKDPSTGADSPPSDPVHFTVDTVKPVVKITRPVDNAWVNNTTAWPVAGTVMEPDGATPVAGATVVVTNKGPLGTAGEKLCEAVADSNGRWTCDVAAGKPGPEDPGNQPYTIRAVATDLAGNVSDPAEVNVVIKNVVDVKITDPKANDTFNATTKPAGAAGVTIVVTGTGESVGDVVEVSDGAGHLCTTNVTANVVSTNPIRYAWSCTLTDVPDSPIGGTTTLTATETDKAGNKGTDSVPVLVDTIAPPAPPVTKPLPGTNISTTPTFEGTGETPGDTITVKDVDGNTICVTTVTSQQDADGKYIWSCTVKTPLPAGTGSFDVTETDAAGNVSPPTHVETTVGGLPTPDITDVCNNVKSTTVCKSADTAIATNDDTPIIKGTVPGTQVLPKAAVVEVSGPGGAICTATIQTDRTWQCELPHLDDGVDIVIKATVVDPNTGVRSEPDTVTITVDTVPPFIHPDTTDPGNIGVDTEPNADVEIKNDDGKTICTAKADDKGHAICHVVDPDDIPKPGDTIHITATDPAGNTATKVTRIVKVTVADKEVGLPGETSQTATGEYYQPGERVHGTDGSTDLGYQTADSTGKVVFTWKIADADSSLGDHTVVLTGDWSGPGKDTYKVVRTCVGKECNLPATGAGANKTFTTLAGLATAVGLGFIFVFLAWRRREGRKA